MKTKAINSIILFVSLVVINISCEEQRSSKSTNDANIKAITAIIDQQLTEWNNGSVDGFMNGYWKDDSMMFITKNGARYGWENVRKMYHKSFPNREKMGNLSFDLQRIHPIGDEVYQVLGRWIVEEKTGKKSGYFSLLFHKIHGEWKIVIDHTFSD